MSLILEALKKSEAERRLGQAPGLMTPVAISRTSGLRSRWLLVTGALLGAAALAAGWWWTSRTVDSEDVLPPSDGSVAQSKPAGDQAAVVVRSTTIEAPSPADPTPASARTVSRPANGSTGNNPGVASRPSVLSVSATPDAMPSDPQFASVERESIPIAATTSISQATQAVAPADVAPLPQQPAASSSPTPPPVETSSPVDSAIEAPDLPRLVQLAASERGALPPLKLSMHVYAPQAPDRFVLIDGRRYREGEKLAASLQIIEIRRDGVVLDFNGRRFLLMRP
jgi:general secretion pathway protein B